MEMIKLKVNGIEVEARPGQTILEMTRELKLDNIPTLCHSPELEPFGSCFVCVVEVKGRPNLVPACATRIAPGMEVETRNPRILASRKTALELLLSNHYADCVSPCLLGCPAQVDAQGYIALAAMGLHREAVDLIRESNPLPAVCGRVCVRKCELVCRRADVDEAVGINAVKRFVTDAPGVYDGQPERAASRGKSVGIIGAGPAGLTAAWFLGRLGYDPVLYEAMERSGGMLRYGIPTYRLPDDVIDREVEYICKAGARIEYNVRIGRDVSLEELRSRHEALFIASGAWTAKPMRLEGEFSTAGVEMGVDFLRRKADDPTPVSGTVVVVGGGNTAMDVARTSWRCGAEKVIILYRRTRSEMPADKMEIHDCLEEGIEIMELAAPVGIVAKDGRLQALSCIRMKLGEPDASGRARPIPMEGSEFELPCSLAVAAIGQDPLVDGLREIGQDEIAFTRWATFKVDPENMASNIPGVFAGGDAANDGPTVVIDAIRDGQRAARAIHSFLGKEPFPAQPFVVSKEFWAKPGKAELGELAESPRHEIHLLNVESRKGNFSEVAVGFEPEDTAHEAARCLSCGCLRFEDCDLRLYAEEYGVDMKRFAGYVRKHRLDDRHPYLVYDPNKCILCARCIRTCSRVLPISALGLVGRGFRTEMRPAMNDPLVETNCISCGNCVDSCPTGALTVKYPFPGRASLKFTESATHCGFCSIGCAVKVRDFGQGRYHLGPSGVPGAYLCRYGRFGHELFQKGRRLTVPEILSEGVRRPTDFNSALQTAKNGLTACARKYGPESVAVFISPEASNEEMYLAARIAREGLGTANVGSLTLLATGKEGNSLDRCLGFTASSADRSVLAQADLIVCNNTSTESDHLILAVDILQSVRHGAKLIVANSTLDTADLYLSTLAMDPMRGQAAILWQGVLQALLDEGILPENKIRELPEGSFLLDKLGRNSLQQAADLSGVSVENIVKAARLLRQAERVVFVHSPDRSADQAPGDMENLANLTLLLNAAGMRADLLLAPMTANAAGLTVSGADPTFAPGRRPAPELPGARSRAELQALLEDGKIRAALIIGEDPLSQEKSAAGFRNCEFLAVMDWARTETIQAADAALPGNTYLEAEGGRINFEGRLNRFQAAVSPPAGRPGWQVLAELAAGLGVFTRPGNIDEISGQLARLVAENLGNLAAYYWNTGQQHDWNGRGVFAPMEIKPRPGSIPPPLTHAERYKKNIREVGTERFRVL